MIKCDLQIAPHRLALRKGSEENRRRMARGEYGDVHRLVVQTFMSKRVMLEKEAMELVKSSCRKFPDCGVAEPKTANELA